MLRTRILYSNLFILSLGCSIQAETPTVRKSSYIRYTEEKVGDKTFVHRIDLVDGQWKECWAINKKKTTKEVYEEALLEAEKELRRAELRAQEEQRQKEDAAHIEHQVFVQKAKMASQKKQLSLLIGQIAAEKHRLADEKLKPYYAYSPSTLDSENAFVDLDAKLHRAQALLENSDATMEELMSLIDALDTMPDRLHEFFKDTVKKAIDTGSDTKLLKELLSSLE